MKKLSPEEVKAAADRAEARSRGSADAAADVGADKEYEFKAGDPPDSFDWPECTRNGAPLKGSMMNVRKAIDVLKLTTRHDVFLDVYTIEGNGLGKFVGEIDDKVVRKFRELCFKELGYEPGKEAAFEGVQRACEENQFNPIKDYLSGLRWDGVRRLDTWLTTYLGVADTPLHRAQGRLVLLAAVRRAFDPGCKFDTVLALEGPEGGGKSTAVKVLACGRPADARPLYFSDSTILDKIERDQMELTKGVWFYELSEMSGAAKADQKKLKAFVTRQEERARAAYAHFPTRQPRIAIFIASVNPDPNTNEVAEYLNPGDRRRWWPMTVGDIHTDALIRDRDQLFAEAMSGSFDALTGEPTAWKPLTLDPKLWKAAEAEAIEREIPDTAVDRLAPLYTDLTKPIKRGEARVTMGKAAALGSDYDMLPPGAFVSGKRWPNGAVTVSSKFVIDLLPPAMTNDGRRMTAAMGKLGWSKYRTKTTRGYVQAMPVVFDDSEFA